MQSPQISSKTSSSSDRAYVTRKDANSVSESCDGIADIRLGSSAAGLVLLYMALKMAGIVIFGRDPSRV